MRKKENTPCVAVARIWFRKKKKETGFDWESSGGWCLGVNQVCRGEGKEEENLILAEALF